MQRGLGPRLLGVRAEPPHAMLLSTLPGAPMEKVRLGREQELAVCRAAVAALARLHDVGFGPWFGACRRDGSCAGEPFDDAVECVRRQLHGRAVCARGC